MPQLTSAVSRPYLGQARSLVLAEVGSSFDPAESEQQPTPRRHRLFTASRCEQELTLGFHWPPWYSVPWLHLHAIYPRSRLRRRYKYTPFSFKSPEWVVERCTGGKVRR